jgi:hypothetical protein
LDVQQEREMSGLVQRFHLEADTHAQLVSAIAILLEWNSTGVKFYATGKDHARAPYLSLLWGKPDAAPDVQAFIAPMADPEAIAMQIEAWLKTAEYGRQPDHDGDNGKGYRLVNGGPTLSAPGTWKNNPWGFYSVLTVTPCWIEYHK